MRSKLDKILEAILTFIMAILVVDVIWQVLSRYVLSSPSSFTDETATFLLIWIGLLGAAYVFGQGEHLAIDLLENSLKSEKNRVKLKLFINLVVLIFVVAVLIVGGSWLVYTRLYLKVTSAALQINLGYIYLVLPISGVITAYYSIDNCIQLLKLKPCNK